LTTRAHEPAHEFAGSGSFPRPLRARRQGPEVFLDAAKRRFHLLVAVLRLGASLVYVQSGQRDERKELQEFGLPVLQCRLRELAREVARGYRFIVGALLVGVGLPFRHSCANHVAKNHTISAIPSPNSRQTLLPAECSLRMLRTIDTTTKPSAATESSTTPTIAHPPALTWSLPC
jgi:hypothetical protein